MRSILIAVALLALCASGAFATNFYDANGTLIGPNPGTNITVTVTILGWAQADFQDSSIAFSGVLGVDWDSPVLRGQYSATAQKTADDPWAGQAGGAGWAGGPYFEAADSARIYVRANTAINMAIADVGPLNNGVGGTLPTWFTLSAYDGPLGALIGGIRCAGSPPLPGSGAGNRGTFLYDLDGAGLLRQLAWNAPAWEWPNQDSMPLNVGGPYSAVLGAPLDATLTFVARILRSGLLDPPGIYNTTIPVSFS